MTSPAAIDLVQSAVSTAIVLAAPILVIVISMTLFINVLQTITQLHDHTLTFVPRLIGSAAVILLLLPWLLGRLSEFTLDVYRTAATVH